MFSRLVFSLALLLAAGISAAEEANWVATWAASPQRLWAPDKPALMRVPTTLSNQTVRQIATLSLGGKRVRITLFNAFGSEPLAIGEAHVALSAGGARLAPGSDRKLTFGGRAAFSIPPGAAALSDPVELEAASYASLAVSLYLPQPTSVATFHWDGLQTGYIAAGNVTSQDFKPGSTTTARAFLSSVLADAPPNALTVIAFGDSITDGNASTLDANRRWPDFLARRLAGQPVAVVNAGISGAKLLKNDMGDNALARFERDVLAQPGAKTVILLLGINDIGWSGTPLAPDDALPAPDDLVAVYHQFVARAHLHGIRVLGGTLLPFEGALHDTPQHNYWTPAKEKLRRAVNQWIRTSGTFDAVIDFDAALRDPAHPARLLPAYDAGDHLHPNDAGDKALAEAVDLEKLR